MERDQADGGNMYARFAMCYLKMTGLDQDRQGLRRPAPQEAEALSNAEGGQAQEHVQRLQTHALKNADAGTGPQIGPEQHATDAPANASQVCLMPELCPVMPKHTLIISIGRNQTKFNFPKPCLYLPSYNFCSPYVCAFDWWKIWTSPSKRLAPLSVIHMNFLRRILGISVKDHVANVDSLSEWQVPSV